MNDSKLNYNDVRDELANTGHTVYLPEAYVSRQEALYEKESSGGKEFVIGAIVGGLVGAAALFLAPKTGKDLRNDVIIQALCQMLG
ncbi:YtxH domain-containing protein [Kurthia zopfii]|uniref:YtxH domain-containing protein n=1 Tax=Kurthia zopfii TaxID=1650 RepID=UPI000F6D98ED|nr:YtxH domain-containing protein [Kurthia zopfii]VEI08463.1 Gas vesicle protein [Kurthia zopfii]